MSERATADARRIIHPDLAVVLLILFVTATSPAFLENDAAFFNYFANVTGAVPLFYYYGYVSFVAAPIAYAVSGLPFVVQALAYRAVALVAVLILYRELLRFFDRGAGKSEARLLAVATLLLLRGVDIHIWANLTYAIWPALLAAALYIVRVNTGDGRYTAIGMAGVVIAALSNPLGLLLAPLLVGFMRFNRHAATHSAVLAVTLAAGHLLIYAQAPDAMIVSTNPLEMARLFFSGYRTEFKLNTLVVFVSMLVIAGGVLWSVAGQRSPADRAIVWSFAFLGAGSVAAYLLSDRFVELGGGFRSQHTLVVMVGALVIAGRAILTLDDRQRRGLWLGMVLGMAVATISREWYFHLRGPLEMSLLKYRFMMVAEAFRDGCREPDVMVFEDDSESPIVLCRPGAFAVGRHPILNVPPAIGVGDDPGNDPLERPGIVVGKPLF